MTKAVKTALKISKAMLVANKTTKKVLYKQYVQAIKALKGAEHTMLDREENKLYNALLKGVLG